MTLLRTLTITLSVLVFAAPACAGPLLRIPYTGDDHLLGNVQDVAVDAGGRVLVLDFQLGDVKVFDPSGGFLAVSSREGEGPGETRKPTGLLVGEDGSIGILSRVSSKIEWINADGTPLETLRSTEIEADGGLLSLWVGERRGDVLALALVTLHVLDDGVVNEMRIVRRVGDTGGFVTLCSEERKDAFVPDSIDEPWFHEPLKELWALGPDGTVYVAADRESLTLTAYPMDGESYEIRHPEGAARVRTGEQKQEIRERIRGQYRNLGDGLKVTACDTWPAVDGLTVLDDGRIVVLVKERGPEDTMVRLSAFAPDGTHLGDRRREDIQLGPWDRCILDPAGLLFVRLPEGSVSDPEARIEAYPILQLAR